MSGIPFDDADSEDGWDASDAALAQFDNVTLRIRELLISRLVLTDRQGRIARLLEDRIARLLEDLATIRRRIRDGDLD